MIWKLTVGAQSRCKNIPYCRTFLVETKLIFFYFGFDVISQEKVFEELMTMSVYYKFQTKFSSDL